MFRILEQNKSHAIIKCDISLLQKIEDIYDSNPKNYDNLQMNLDPQDVINFIDGLQTHDRTTTKIHRQKSLQTTTA